jgi:hypothetical protein
MKRILKFEDWIERVQDRLKLLELDKTRTNTHVSSEAGSLFTSLATISYS